MPSPEQSRPAPPGAARGLGRRALILVLHRRRCVLFAWALLALFAALGLPRLRVDNSPEGFFARDVKALEDYRDFRHLFGRDRALRVALSGPALWTPQGLRWQAELEDGLQALPEVLGAAGLSSRRRHGEDPWPPTDPATLRAAAIADPLDRGAGWISDSGEIATILMVLWNLDRDRQTRLLGEVDTLVAAPPEGLAVAVTGLPVLERALDAEVQRFARRFFPWLALLAGATLWLAFRDVSAVLVSLAFVGTCLLAVLGARGWAGAQLDVVSIVLLPLVFVTALATAVHVIVRYRQLRAGRGTGRAAVRAAYREKAWPILWSGLTTAAGFASLAVSPTPPVARLGVWSALAMLTITAAAFSLLPALLTGVGAARASPRSVRFEVSARAWGMRCAAWAVAQRRAVALGAGALTLAALAGLGGLRADPGPMAFLPAGHPVRAQSEWLASNGLGPVSAELVLRAAPGTARPSFDAPAELERLARLTGSLRRDPHVLSALGPQEVVAHSLPGPVPAGAEEAGARIALLRRKPETAPYLAAVLTPAGDAARISLGLPMLGHAELAPTLAAAAARARQAFPGLEVFVTGRYPLVVAAQESVLRTMLLSLSLTLLVVGGLFGLLLRRRRLVVAALAPNLFPVACAIGALGWFRLPLDGGTVMIAATVLGLAVDDTLHALGAFRRERVAGPPGEAPGKAAVSALERTAPGHLLTTAVLVSGFAICALSPYLPIARFGALTAVGLVAALAADLFLLPALVAGTDGGQAA